MALQRVLTERFWKVWNFPIIEIKQLCLLQPMCPKQKLKLLSAAETPLKVEYTFRELMDKLQSSPRHMLKFQFFGNRNDFFVRWWIQDKCFFV